MPRNPLIDFSHKPLCRFLFEKARQIELENNAVTGSHDEAMFELKGRASKDTIGAALVVVAWDAAIGAGVVLGVAPISDEGQLIGTDDIALGTLAMLIVSSLQVRLSLEGITVDDEKAVNSLMAFITAGCDDKASFEVASGIHVAGSSLWESAEVEMSEILERIGERIDMEASRRRILVDPTARVAMATSYALELSSLIEMIDGLTE